MERRNFERCPGHLRLRVFCRSGDCVQGIASNVSEGGIFVEGPPPEHLRPGVRVLVQVQGVIMTDNPWVEMEVSRICESGIGLCFPSRNC
ncbi:MAG: PilZ domain-containing protein [Gammaproteobacteria bacterium]|nr:MAG: PilZ domain-containing protein [Gammaproteobacteria bacterium]